VGTGSGVDELQRSDEASVRRVRRVRRVGTRSRVLATFIRLGRMKVVARQFYLQMLVRTPSQQQMPNIPICVSNRDLVLLNLR
jgi:hypothetical protein